MLDMMLNVVLTFSPLFLVAGLLVVAERRDATRAEAIARQIWLTDALGSELGAVVAPTVTRGDGVWTVRVALPLERATLVGRVVALSREALARFDTTPVEIVLTPRPDDRNAIRTSEPVGRGRAPLPLAQLPRSSERK